MTHLSGLNLMALSVALFSINDGLLKIACTASAPMTVVFFRSLMSCGILVLLFWKNRALMRTQFLENHILRSALGVGALILSGFALKGISVSSFVACFYLSPFFLSLLSIAFLKEKITLGLWVTLGSGLLGTFLIMNPESDVFSVHGAAAMTAAFFYATTITIAKKTSAESISTNFFYNTVVALAATSGFTFFDAGPLPSSQDLALICAMALIQYGGFYLIFLALRKEQASRIALVEYTGLFWAILMDILIWYKAPEFMVLLGVSVILIGQLYLVYNPVKKA